MLNANPQEEYLKALKAGQKEARALAAAGKDPHPACLEDILPEADSCSRQELGLRSVPAARVVGTASGGRAPAFSAGFLPLLENGSEFSAKWETLCDAHMNGEGIRDPVSCYEYLGDYYVREGNKRVSLLKYCGAVTIEANVCRLLPTDSEDPKVRAYREYLEFYKMTGFAEPVFRRPGDYAKLLACLGKDAKDPWTEEQKKRFLSLYHAFQTAFNAGKQDSKDVLCEEAFLLCLQLYSFADLEAKTPAELKKLISGLWADIRTESTGDTVQMGQSPSADKQTLLDRLTAPSHIRAAFLYQGHPESSTWAFGHEEGQRQAAAALGGHAEVRSYYHADSPEQTDALISQAIEEGAQVIFTTTPPLLRSTLKAALANPKIRFFNCSAAAPFSSVNGYYCRIFEAKFLMGLLAGALSRDGRIGYIGSYPILGVPASVNAFALGARMTCPGAKILLRWSCLPGDPMEELLSEGVRIISNRDVPAGEEKFLHGGDFGVYQMNDHDQLEALGSPCWVWGRFYEDLLRSLLSGTYKNCGSAGEAISYWLGMDSGVVDIRLTDAVPAGTRFLVETMADGLRKGTYSPFAQPVTDQQGQPRGKNGAFSLTDILHMNWLCENVEGRIPLFDELLPMSQPLVQELGLNQEDRLPVRKEAFL